MPDRLWDGDAGVPDVGVGVFFVAVAIVDSPEEKGGRPEAGSVRWGCRPNVGSRLGALIVATPPAASQGRTTPSRYLGTSSLPRSFDHRPVGSAHSSPW